jgi:hypothetical protein
MVADADRRPVRPRSSRAWEQALERFGMVARSPAGGVSGDGGVKRPRHFWGDGCYFSSSIAVMILVASP